MSDFSRAQPWHHTVRVGDRVAKIIQNDFWAYQEIIGIQRNTRRVRSFTALSISSQGELGDTYLADMVALIDNGLWNLLQINLWPWNLNTLDVRRRGIQIKIYCDMVERDGVLCPILKYHFPLPRS